MKTRLFAQRFGFIAGFSLLVCTSQVLRAAPTTFPATTRPALEPLQGWTVKADTPPDRPAIRTNLLMPVPLRSGGEVAFPNRPGTAVLIYEHGFNAFYESWDLSTARRRGQLLGKLDLNAPAISPDGKYLAGGYREKNEAAVDIYTFQSQQRIQRLALNSERHKTAEVIGFVADDRIATLCDKRVDVWEIKTGKKLVSFDLWLDAAAKHMALSPNGNYLAMAGGGRLMIYDLGDGSLAGQATLETEDNGPRRRDGMAEAMAFSMDGMDLAAVFKQGSGFRQGGEYRLVIWDVRSGRVLSDNVAEAKQNMGYKGAALEWMPDGNGLVLWGKAFIDRHTAKPIFEVQEPPGGLREPVRMASATHIIVPHHESGRGIMFEAVRLPREQMDKALAAIRAGGKAGDEFLPPLTIADISAARQLKAGTISGKALDPDGVAPRKLPPGPTAIKASPPGAMPPGRKADFRPDIRELAFSSPTVAQALVFLGLHDPRPGTFRYFKAWVERYDIAANRLVDVAEVPPTSSFLDYGADGKLVLLKTAEDRTDLFALGGTGKPVCGWRPYERENDKSARSVSWGAIIDDKHVLTLSGRGELVLWEIPGCKAVYTLTGLRSSGNPAISSGRKYVAATVQDSTAVIDTLTGETLLVVPISSFNWNASFSPEGDLLAIYAGDEGVRIYDLSTGRIANEFALPKDIGWRRPLQWVGPHHLLVGRQYLVDLKLRAVIWGFYVQGYGEQGPFLPDDRFWFLAQADLNKPPGILAVALPHAPAQELAATLKPDDVLLIKPGMKVSLDVSVGGTEEERKQAVDALTARLKENGMEVADGANVRLQATMTPTTSRTVTYGGQPATITDYEARLAFLVEGRNVWERKHPVGGYAPMMIQLRPGETAQQVLSNQPKGMLSGPFVSARIPKYVAKSLEEMKIGYSRLTAAGAFPAEPPKPAPTVPIVPQY